MKKILYLIIAVLMVISAGCKKDLKVEGPGVGSGPVTITVVAPTPGEIIPTGMSYVFHGTVAAPKGLDKAVLTVLGQTYTITFSGDEAEFAFKVSIPATMPTGQAFSYSIIAYDIDGQSVQHDGTFTLSKGLNAFILGPIAGHSDAILSGLSGIFKMRMNYKDVPQSIGLKIIFSPTNILEVSIDLANSNEFAADPDYGPNSFIAQKTLTIPSSVEAGTYDYMWVITTDMETLELSQKVEVQKITTLFVLGDATTAGWDINNPVSLNNTGSNQFSKMLPLAGSPKGFKFVLKQGSWDVNWGTFESAAITLGTDYDLNPGGNNIMVADTGNYIISVNFETNKFKVIEFTPPDSLYLVGGSTPADWKPSAALAFTEMSPGVFQIFSPIKISGSGFKFLPHKGTWDGDWGDSPAATGGLAQDGENNCTVADSGFYRVTVDFTTMKWEVLKTDWGIIGSAIPPYNWSVDVDMTYVGGAEPFTWIISNYDVLGAEFKFRANDAWTTNFGDDGNNGSLEYNGANIPITAGTKTIKLILEPNNWTYSVTP
ncbi:MAG: SusF/SusE family outer membrane protein [Bacteroidales bacterium]